MFTPGKLALYAALILSGTSVSAEAPDASDALQRAIAKLLQQKSENAPFRASDPLKLSQIRTSRPDVPTGTHISLFANFLEEECGSVLLTMNGTTQNCNVVQWLPRSVTLQLPALGIARPADAEISIVKPDGRVAKSFAVRIVPQPQLVIHGETVTQPMPPTYPDHSDDDHAPQSDIEALEEVLAMAIQAMAEEQSEAREAAIELTAEAVFEKRNMEARPRVMPGLQQTRCHKPSPEKSRTPSMKPSSRQIGGVTQNARPHHVSPQPGVHVRSGAMMLFGTLD